MHSDRANRFTSETGSLVTIILPDKENLKNWKKSHFKKRYQDIKENG